MKRKGDHNRVKKLLSQFGNWQVDCEIGRGSYGVVYKIWKREHGKKIYAALKHIHIGPTSDNEKLLEINEAKKYYWNEVEKVKERIEIVRSLNGHPNVVPIDDFKIFKDNDGVSYDILLRMKLLTPIDSYYASFPPSEKEILHLGVDVCSALVKCEEIGVAHHDVKSDNIYIDESHNYLLGDFGVASTIKQPNFQRTMIINGDECVQPESDESNVSVGSDKDIMSLGAVLYTYLNDNKSPYYYFDNGSFTETRRFRIISSSVSGKPLAAPKNANTTFAEIILRALRSERNDRYLNANDFESALKNVDTVSDEPLWTPESRVKSGNVKSHSHYIHKRSSRNMKSNERRLHNDRIAKVIGKLISWLFATCLLSLIPLFVFLFFRRIFSLPVPVNNKITTELLYLGLTLAVVTLRELLNYENERKETTIYRSAFWITIICLSLSAILFVIMTANDLSVFRFQVSEKDMLIISSFVSFFSFSLGAIVQAWGA